MKSKGFTLIEILVAVAIMGIVSTSIMSVYLKNTKVYTVQTEVVRTQQDLRSVLNYMTSHIQMAGYNPPTIDYKISGVVANTNKASEQPFIIATEGSLEFGMDYDPSDSSKTDDGTIAADETFRFSLRDDANDDGIADNGMTELWQDGNTQMADNIQAIAFSYAIDADNDDAGGIDTYTSADGNDVVLWVAPRGGTWTNLDTNNDGVLTVADDTSGDNVLNGVDTTINVNLDHIKAIRVDILARAANIDREYTDNNRYVVGGKIINGGGDHYRRRLLSDIIRCRNL